METFFSSADSVSLPAKIRTEDALISETNKIRHLQSTTYSTRMKFHRRIRQPIVQCLLIPRALTPFQYLASRTVLVFLSNSNFSPFALHIVESSSVIR